MVKRYDILSLFPDMFKGPLDESMIKRARESGVLDIRLHNIRDYARDKHKRVDDRPYGGGPGMVMMPQPVVDAVRDVASPLSRTVYLSAHGPVLTAAKCRELAEYEHLVLLCGHYEGVDERAIEAVVDEEISIGSYVLTNGCLPAMVLLDAVARFIPGVLGHEEAASQDSFEEGILDCPHYTRPENFEDQFVPETLLSGNHKRIEKWRREAALAKTVKNRPDLIIEEIS